MIRDLNTRNPPFHIRSYRKVHTFRESMSRLHQSKNQYPVDLLNRLLLDYDQQIQTLFDERLSEGHD